MNRVSKVRMNCLSKGSSIAAMMVIRGIDVKSG